MHQKTSDEIIQKDLAELPLKDSAQLIHIKDLFYRSKPGQLFEETIAQREEQGIDTLVDVTYFNGMVPQDIDPLTFEQLDGLFAKDKNSIYEYRPTSGGMFCIKMPEADYKTFKVVYSDGFYAVDKNHLYKETQIVEGINPLHMRLIKDKDGTIIKIVSGKRAIKTDTL